VKRNKFSKALKHLKSKKIDDKIKSLEEAGPTNSMSGVYQVTPDTGDGFRMGPGDPEKKFYPKADGTWPSGIPANASDTVYIRKGGYFDSGKGVVPHNQTPVSRDFSYDDVTANGTTNTNTLIRPSDGKPYTALPEGTESFILGPLVGNYAINHGYDDYTNIGYIQKDTRQFVLLATIQGFFKGEDRPRTSYGGGNARTFDGTASQFTSYNSNFKLEHALWMLDRYNKSDFADNFPFNFSGGVPVERHPDNNSMGMGVILGILNALFGGDSDNIGTPQDAADSNDINSLNLMGLINDMFKKFGKNWQDNTEGMGDKLKDNLKKVLDQTKNFVDDLFDANNAADFNAKLALSLGLSIISGKKIDIPLSDSAKKDLINNIDADALKDVIKINDSTPTTADEAINPSGNKSDKVLGGGWDAQGGVDFNYNEETGELEIVSNKTLRTDSGGETTIKDKRGPNFEVDKLTDIPDSSKQNVQDMSTKIISDISTKLGGPGLDPNGDIDLQLKFMRDTFDDNKIASAITDIASDLITQGTQGTAQNILALRKALKNLSIKSPVDTDAWKPFSGDSDIEKAGGAAGHVTSTTKVKLDDLPADIQKVIKDKLNKSESYIMESKKRILREVKRPILIEATPKTTKLKGYRPNFKGKFSPQNTPDVTASKKSDDIVSGKNASRQIWTAKDKYWKGYETTERMNIIYDNLGHGSQYFDRIVGENVRLKNKKSREVQEHLNMLAHQKALREVYGIKEYKDIIDESETYDNKVNDPLFTKVAKRLKKEIDYPKKPSPKGYPNEAPPKIDPNTGMHPKFGKRYKYDKLDPQSAEGMPMQGDSEIDANIQKATDSKRKARKIKNLLGK